MANYNPQLTTNLGVGESQVLTNATLTTPFSTQAIAVGRDGAQTPIVAFFNNTALLATIQAAPVDVDAAYVACTTVAAGNALYFTTIGPFLRVSFPSDPGATTFTVVR